MAPHPLQKHLSSDDIPGIYSSVNASLNVPATEDSGRPQLFKHSSTPSYQSPARHHRRAKSATREVKETLNARSEYSNSEDDGTAQHRINQYIIQQEIGRGSFGAVHLALDQYGFEYAIKEFSKSRLRKRAQSELLRRPSARRRHNALAPRTGFNSPLHRHSSEENNSLELIKEEIAVMKKLGHPNLVGLIEVLDDPEEDSLYMVLELCKKGVVMRVGLGERADPYGDEQCRHWFRDMILGIEYLHAQGILHRDIKPDNCLICEDDVLKIVDFGVSEMFEKESEMNTAKSVGSPAFMPPELCIAKHGHVSGKAVDIWSMGVTLYCLRFGRIPFEKAGMLDLYEAIKNDIPTFGDGCDEDLQDLLLRLLEKDPQKRIKMPELREHAWVTRRGTDPLLSTEENVAVIVGDPTDEEYNAAITGNMSHLVTVMKAVKRFKQLLFRKRPDLVEGILGRGSKIVQPPQAIPHRDNHSHLTASGARDQGDPQRAHVAQPKQGDVEGVSMLGQLPDEIAITGPQILGGGIDDAKRVPPFELASPSQVDMHNRSTTPQGSPIPTDTQGRKEIGKGQAHDPLEDKLYLRIGPSSDCGPIESAHMLSESPGAVNVNVYETAYQEEIERILAERDKKPTLYLTRRVEGIKEIRENLHIFDNGHIRTIGKPGLARLLDKAKAIAQMESTTTPSE